MGDLYIVTLGAVIWWIAVAAVFTTVMIVAAFVVGLRLGRRDAGCCCDDGPELAAGHPERVGGMGDPVADMEFGDIAEELLDDGLAEVAERLGWME